MTFGPLEFLAFFVVGAYGLALMILMLYGLHRYWILFLYWRYHRKGNPPPLVRPEAFPDGHPHVTVQLPLYNEMYVAERLLQAVSNLDYPKDKLEIQVLDDSTDQTLELVAGQVERLKGQGYDIVHLRRPTRSGFKAGALAWGLARAKGEFVAIFDADFIPPAGFLLATLPHFREANVGMVQTRWGHINPDYSLLTRVQALFLDGHFLLEHTARYKSGAFFNFNGTAGIWRKEAIESAGGWSARTLTEDLDLSYRAQLAGWKFVYDPSFVCPAELPVDIHAFRSQQSRWAKGALQVARHLLKDLWKANLPLHTKVEATVHLTGNVGYLLTVFVALLLLPSLLLRHLVGWASIDLLEVVAFVSTTASISIFYMVSQRELYPDWKWKLKDIPALLSLGIGMCVSNASAVFEGLIGRSSDFIRTPKYNIRSQTDAWRRKIYAGRKPSSWKTQLVFALYSLLTLSIATLLNNWVALPFILMFVFGFSYIAGLSLLHNSSQE